MPVAPSRSNRLTNSQRRLCPRTKTSSSVQSHRSSFPLIALTEFVMLRTRIYAHRTPLPQHGTAMESVAVTPRMAHTRLEAPMFQ